MNAVRHNRERQAAFALAHVSSPHWPAVIGMKPAAAVKRKLLRLLMLGSKCQHGLVFRSVNQLAHQCCPCLDQVC